MQLSEIRNNLGSLIDQVDDSGEFVAGHITQNEADDWINQAYERVYMRYVRDNKERFVRESYANTVANQAKYAFDSEADDLLGITWLGIKYSSTDDDYLHIKPADFPDIMLSGYEEVSETDPLYYRESVYDSDSDTYTPGFRLAAGCVPEESVSNGLRLRYIERPNHLDSDTDTPQKIPSEFHQLLVDGAGYKALRKKDQYAQAAEVRTDFQNYTELGIINDPAKLSDGKLTVKPKRSFINRFYKRRS
jgi:hypothetical protein